MRVRMISQLHYKPAEETTGMLQAVINLLSFFWEEHVAALCLMK